MYCSSVSTHQPGKPSANPANVYVPKSKRWRVLSNERTRSVSKSTRQQFRPKPGKQLAALEHGVLEHLVTVKGIHEGRSKSKLKAESNSPTRSNSGVSGLNFKGTNSRFSISSSSNDVVWPAPFTPSFCSDPRSSKNESESEEGSPDSSIGRCSRISIDPSDIHNVQSN